MAIFRAIFAKNGYFWELFSIKKFWLYFGLVAILWLFFNLFKNNKN